MTRSVRSKLKRTRKTALDRGQTDRISLTMTLTLTNDFDLQSPASYGHDLIACKSSMSTVSWFQRQNGNKRTDEGDCITYRVNAVDKNVKRVFFSINDW